MKLPIKRPILNKLVWITVVTLLLAAYIMLTNPNNIPLPLILLPFVLIGLLLYQVTSLAVSWQAIDKGTRTYRLLPASISFIGVTLLVLASLHQLTWKDVLLVALFTGLFWLYVGRADFLHK